MKKNKLVPRLRFQEFKNSPSWTIIKLNSVADKITERNKNNSISKVFTNSAINGVVDQEDYFDRNIANKNNLSSYFIIKKGDYVYNPRKSTLAPFGPISKNKIGTGVMSPLYTIFRFKNENNDFYEQFFLTNLWHKYIENISNTGARHDRITITSDNFMNMPILFSSEEEQQKIADCLASIDDLIEAEKRKLEVLKKYKKALMQKLFPSEDSSMPELRFAEFKDSGEWENKKLSEIGKFIRGFSYKGEDTTNDTSKLLIIRSNNIIPMGITDYKNGLQYVQKPCKEEQKLITGDITICMANGSRDLVGKASFYDGMYSGDITVGAFCGIFRSKLNITRYLFQTNLYKKKLDIILSGGNGSIANLRGEDILNLSFYIPKNFQEQQKIADCLASIDSVIDSQVKRIDNLIKHKKALMQGLFPDMESIEEYE